MSNSNLQAWLDLFELALKYGVPLVKEIIATWAADMTPEEIRAKMDEYAAKLKKSEEYFN